MERTLNITLRSLLAVETVECFCREDRVCFVARFVLDVAMVTVVFAGLDDVITPSFDLPCDALLETAGTSCLVTMEVDVAMETFDLDSAGIRLFYLVFGRPTLGWFCTDAFLNFFNGTSADPGFWSTCTFFIDLDIGFTI